MNIGMNDTTRRRSIVVMCLLERMTAKYPMAAITVTPTTISDILDAVIAPNTDSSATTTMAATPMAPHLMR